MELLVVADDEKGKLLYSVKKKKKRGRKKRVRGCGSERQRQDNFKPSFHLLQDPTSKRRLHLKMAK